MSEVGNSGRLPGKTVNDRRIAVDVGAMAWVDSTMDSSPALTARVYAAVSALVDCLPEEERLPFAKLLANAARARVIYLSGRSMACLPAEANRPVT